MASKGKKGAAPQGKGAADGSPAQHPVCFIEISKLSDPSFNIHEKASSRPSTPESAPTSEAFLGRIEIELFTDLVPRTCDNFRQLCVGCGPGEKGKGAPAKVQHAIGYKNTRILRITDEAIQFGDVQNREDGKGQESIFGSTFDDEKLGAVPHKRGVVSMVNSGPNTNGSQFFLCLGDHPYMDAHYVSFGKIVLGDNVLQALEGQLREEAAATLRGDQFGMFRRTCSMYISNCGMAEGFASSRVPSAREGISRQ